MTRRVRAARWPLPLALALAACASDRGDDGIEITGAWARATPAGATTGAVYLTITSPADDVLEGASSAVAGSAQLHMTMNQSDDTSMMHQVDGLEVPAGEPVVLEPRGYHVMLVDLAAPLETGTSFDLRLQLARGDDVTIEVPVRDDAP